MAQYLKYSRLTSLVRRDRVTGFFFCFLVNIFLRVLFHTPFFLRKKIEFGEIFEFKVDPGVVVMTSLIQNFFSGNYNYLCLGLKGLEYYL
jgi:hypothetical protein